MTNWAYPARWGGPQTSWSPRSPRGGQEDCQKGLPPNAVTVGSAGSEAAFLEPLPVDMLWGVGAQDNAKLAGYDIKTIATLPAARRPINTVVRRERADLARRALGWTRARWRPNTPLDIGSARRQPSCGTCATIKKLAGTLRELSAEVGHRLRQDRIVR